MSETPLLDAVGVSKRFGAVVALLCFNVGIELGQIAVIIAVLVVMAALRWALNNRVPVPAYAWALGCVAGMWTLERVAGVF